MLVIMAPVLSCDCMNEHSYVKQSLDLNLFCDYNKCFIGAVFCFLQKVRRKEI